MHRALVVLILLAGPASAEDPKGEGEYGGVQPGQTKKPDAKKPDAKKGKPPAKGTLSWIGFEASGGGADVFFQSVAPFEISQRVEKGALIVSLSGLTRLGHNIWRPIDTRFFDTAIARIVARRKGKGIEVRIAFKQAKDAAQGSVRSGAEPDGMYYAHVTFGGGGGGGDAKPPEK